jgi:hypothetical protein
VSKGSYRRTDGFVLNIDKNNQSLFAQSISTDTWSTEGVIEAGDAEGDNQVVVMVSQ